MRISQSGRAGQSLRWVLLAAALRAGVAAAQCPDDPACAATRTPLRRPAGREELDPIPHYEPTPKPVPLSRFVSDIGLGAVLMYLPEPGGQFIPGIAARGQWGVRLTDVVALVGAVNCDVIFAPMGTVTFLSVAPGLRIWERHHLTLSAGPELFFFYHPASPFLLATARVDFAFVVAESLGVQLQGGVHFDPTGIQTIQAGVGFTWVRL